MRVFLSRYGFTLTEIMLIILLSGLAIAPIMLSYSLSFRQAEDTVSLSHLNELADTLMEEILAKPFEDPQHFLSIDCHGIDGIEGGDNEITNPTGEGADILFRYTFDDVDDYHGHIDPPTGEVPLDPWGNELDSIYSGLKRRVDIFLADGITPLKSQDFDMIDSFEISHRVVDMALSYDDNWAYIISQGDYQVGTENFRGLLTIRNLRENITGDPVYLPDIPTSIQLDRSGEKLFISSKRVADNDDNMVLDDIISIYWTPSEQYDPNQEGLFQKIASFSGWFRPDQVNDISVFLNIIVVATDDGLWLSQDQGENWRFWGQLPLDEPKKLAVWHQGQQLIVSSLNRILRFRLDPSESLNNCFISQRDTENLTISSMAISHEWGTVFFVAGGQVGTLENVENGEIRWMDGITKNGIELAPIKVAYNPSNGGFILAVGPYEYDEIGYGGSIFECANGQYLSGPVFSLPENNEIMDIRHLPKKNQLVVGVKGDNDHKGLWLVDIREKKETRIWDEGYIIGIEKPTLSDDFDDIYAAGPTSDDLNIQVLCVDLEANIVKTGKIISEFIQDNQDFLNIYRAWPAGQIWLTANKKEIFSGNDTDGWFKYGSPGTIKKMQISPQGDNLTILGGKGLVSVDLFLGQKLFPYRQNKPDGEKYGDLRSMALEFNGGVDLVPSPSGVGRYILVDGNEANHETDQIISMLGHQIIDLETSDTVKPRFGLADPKGSNLYVFQEESIKRMPVYDGFFEDFATLSGWQEAVCPNNISEYKPIFSSQPQGLVADFIGSGQYYLFRNFDFPFGIKGITCEIKVSSLPNGIEAKVFLSNNQLSWDDFPDKINSLEGYGLASGTNNCSFLTPYSQLCFIIQFSVENMAPLPPGIIKELSIYFSQPQDENGEIIDDEDIIGDANFVHGVFSGDGKLLHFLEKTGNEGESMAQLRSIRLDPPQLARIYENLSSSIKVSAPVLSPKLYILDQDGDENNNPDHLRIMHMLPNLKIISVKAGDPINGPTVEIRALKSNWNNSTEGLAQYKRPLKQQFSINDFKSPENVIMVPRGVQAEISFDWEEKANKYIFLPGSALKINGGASLDLLEGGSFFFLGGHIAGDGIPISSFTDYSRGFSPPLAPANRGLPCGIAVKGGNFKAQAAMFYGTGHSEGLLEEDIEKSVLSVESGTCEIFNSRSKGWVAENKKGYFSAKNSIFKGDGQGTGFLVRKLDELGSNNIKGINLFQSCLFENWDQALDITSALLAFDRGAFLFCEKGALVGMNTDFCVENSTFFNRGTGIAISLEKNSCNNQLYSSIIRGFTTGTKITESSNINFYLNDFSECDYNLETDLESSLFSHFHLNRFNIPRELHLNAPVSVANAGALNCQMNWWGTNIFSDIWEPDSNGPFYLLNDLVNCKNPAFSGYLNESVALEPGFNPVINHLSICPSGEIMIPSGTVLAILPNISNSMIQLGSPEITVSGGISLMGEYFLPENGRGSLTSLRNTSEISIRIIDYDQFLPMPTRVMDWADPEIFDKANGFLDFMNRGPERGDWGGLRLFASELLENPRKIVPNISVSPKDLEMSMDGSTLAWADDDKIKMWKRGQLIEIPANGAYSPVLSYNGDILAFINRGGASQYFINTFDYREYLKGKWEISTEPTVKILAQGNKEFYCLSISADASVAVWHAKDSSSSGEDQIWGWRAQRGVFQIYPDPFSLEKDQEIKFALKPCIDPDGNWASFIAPNISGITAEIYLVDLQNPGKPQILRDADNKIVVVNEGKTRGIKWVRLSRKNIFWEYENGFNKQIEAMPLPALNHLPYTLGFPFPVGSISSDNTNPRPNGDGNMMAYLQDAKTIVRANIDESYSTWEEIDENDNQAGSPIIDNSGELMAWSSNQYNESGKYDLFIRGMHPQLLSGGAISNAFIAVEIDGFDGTIRENFISQNRCALSFKNPPLNIELPEIHYNLICDNDKPAISEIPVNIPNNWWGKNSYEEEYFAAFDENINYRPWALAGTIDRDLVLSPDDADLNPDYDEERGLSLVIAGDLAIKGKSLSLKPGIALKLLSGRNIETVGSGGNIKATACTPSDLVPKIVITSIDDNNPFEINHDYPHFQSFGPKNYSSAFFKTWGEKTGESKNMKVTLEDDTRLIIKGGSMKSSDIKHTGTILTTGGGNISKASLKLSKMSMNISDNQDLMIGLANERKGTFEVSNSTFILGRSGTIKNFGNTWIKNSILAGKTDEEEQAFFTVSTPFPHWNVKSYLWGGLSNSVSGNLTVENSFISSGSKGCEHTDSGDFTIKGNMYRGCSYGISIKDNNGIYGELRDSFEILNCDFIDNDTGIFIKGKSSVASGDDRLTINIISKNESFEPILKIKSFFFGGKTGIEAKDANINVDYCGFLAKEGDVSPDSTGIKIVNESQYDALCGTVENSIFDGHDIKECGIFIDGDKIIVDSSPNIDIHIKNCTVENHIKSALSSKYGNISAQYSLFRDGQKTIDLTDSRFTLGNVNGPLVDGDSWPDSTVENSVTLISGQGDSKINLYSSLLAGQLAGGTVPDILVSPGPSPGASPVFISRNCYFGTVSVELTGANGDLRSNIFDNTGISPPKACFIVNNIRDDNNIIGNTFKGAGAIFGDTENNASKVLLWHNLFDGKSREVTGITISDTKAFQRDLYTGFRDNAFVNNRGGAAFLLSDYGVTNFEVNHNYWSGNISDHSGHNIQRTPSDGTATSPPSKAYLYDKWGIFCFKPASSSVSVDIPWTSRIMVDQVPYSGAITPGLLTYQPHLVNLEILKSGIPENPENDENASISAIIRYFDKNGTYKRSLNLQLTSEIALLSGNTRKYGGQFLLNWERKDDQVYHSADPQPNPLGPPGTISYYPRLPVEYSDDADPKGTLKIYLANGQSVGTYNLPVPNPPHMPTGIAIVGDGAEPKLISPQSSKYYDLDGWLRFKVQMTGAYYVPIDKVKINLTGLPDAISGQFSQEFNLSGEQVNQLRNDGLYLNFTAGRLLHNKSVSAQVSLINQGGSSDSMGLLYSIHRPSPPTVNTDPSPWQYKKGAMPYGVIGLDFPVKTTNIVNDGSNIESIQYRFKEKGSGGHWDIITKAGANPEKLSYELPAYSSNKNCTFSASVKDHTGITDWGQEIEFLSLYFKNQPLTISSSGYGEDLHSSGAWSGSHVKLAWTKLLGCDGYKLEFFEQHEEVTSTIFGIPTKKKWMGIGKISAYDSSSTLPDVVTIANPSTLDYGATDFNFWSKLPPVGLPLVDASKCRGRFFVKFTANTSLPGGNLVFDCMALGKHFYQGRRKTSQMHLRKGYDNSHNTHSAN